MQYAKKAWAYRLEKFIRAFKKHNGNATRAYMHAFQEQNPAIGRSQGHRYLKKLEQTLPQVLEDLGQTLHKTLNTHIDIAEQATKPVIVNKELQDYPDYSTRTAANRDLLKLHGVLSDKKDSQDNRSITFNMNDSRIPDIKKALDKINKLTGNNDTPNNSAPYIEEGNSTDLDIIKD